MAAHGLSVVELRAQERDRAVDATSRAPRLNRRVTATTPFAFDGPAAGTALLQTAADPTGTHACSAPSATAPAAPPRGAPSCPARRTSTATSPPRGTGRPGRRLQALRPHRHQAAAAGSAVDPRFDARRRQPNEANRFGWIVEVDPFDPSSTPVKHTALGRFKHEGANVIVGRPTATWWPTWATTSASTTSTSSSRTAASAPAARRKARAHNLTLLSEGDLYVAQFTGDGFADGISDGSGQWLPLVVDDAEPGRRDDRRGGAGLHPPRRRQGRPHQDGPPRGRRAQPASPASIYVVCTNNTDRGKPAARSTRPTRAPTTSTATSSRSPSPGDDTATTFTWKILLIAGDPTDRDDLLRRLHRSRSRRSPARTTSPSTPTATCGSPPTATPSAPATACTSSRCRARTRVTCSSSCRCRPTPSAAARSSPGPADRARRRPAPGRDDRRLTRRPAEPVPLPRRRPAPPGSHPDPPRLSRRYAAGQPRGIPHLTSSMQQAS